MATLTQQQANRLIKELGEDYPELRRPPRKRKPDMPRVTSVRLAKKWMENAGKPFGELQGNATERGFLALAARKGAKVFRDGWPDYLLEMSKRTIGVEVKRWPDRLSERQVKMFAALERLGVSTYVWNPDVKGILVPWRRYIMFDLPVEDTR